MSRYNQLDTNDDPFIDHQSYGYDEEGDLSSSNPTLSEGQSQESHPLSNMPHIVPYSHQHTNSQVPYPTYDSDEAEEKDVDEELDFHRDWGNEERRFTSRPVTALLSDVESQKQTEQEQTERNWARRQNLSLLKRANTRKVGLIQGQVFRTEYPVPSAVRLSILPEYVGYDSTEFSHMRYTAATCDPDDFTPSEGYSLRGLEYGRETELLICITYYNEDKQLLSRTLYGIMQNIRDICRLKRSEFWGGPEEAWKKVQVVLVMDGIEPCDKNVLDVLATIGCYQDGVMKRNVNGEETVAHIFEYTTQLCVLPNQKLVRPEENNPDSLPPIQMTLCIKQHNTKKINSHRWVFNAFCPILRPEVVVLIDAGTRPGTKSLLYLWQEFYNNPHVGGACGEIHAMLGKNKRALLNPLVAAQNFEYKISNILDKPLESTFGYISVLPGAFSAYRYRALEGRPLSQYFLGDHTMAERLGDKGINGMSIFRKNMFLAEDRILCLEVVFKRGEKWHLAYVKRSTAETDVPTTIGDLMGQRRRWLNGSFAAGIYSILHFGRVYRSHQNIIRLIALHVQFMYNLLTQFLSWFNLGCYYLTITIIIELAGNPKEFGSQNNDDAFPFSVQASSIISLIVNYVYALFVVISFILALGNRPKASTWMYYVMILVFGVIQYYGLVISLWLAVNELKNIGNTITSLSQFFSNFFTSTTALVVVALASTFGLYIVSAILYLDPWHLFTSFPQYILMQPSFVNVLNVYAFCNWHDVSWGTKGSDDLTALPTVNAVQDGDEQVVEEVVLDLEDIDRNFQEVVKRALTPYVPVQEKKKISNDDQSRIFRTYLVITWLVSNVVLIWAITSTESAEVGMTYSVRKRIAYFFAVLLWSNAVVAIVRLVGCIAFLGTTYYHRIFSSK
ncbi:hypothetical protein DASB73_005870 [Starmerella bacillaris]|uniref:Chitin synthase n=1 Tax=Starmerella bacillaris TaxID=1247836 RepID=A0AAV5RDJ5_STABA|nr:hypothetical protein DASB73_005870 [Starmerella bacillaris]